ncbi:MAG TPA: potassium channel family protein [Thermomicrobiales bacterium]|nr:potassium channel family protein [Thermomicrobiales bacterium]
MTTGMPIVSTLLGVVLIAFVLRDIFHTLFHPSGIGTLSSTGARYLWRVLRQFARHHRQVLPLAGPLALVAIIATWALVLVLGWALIYWPHLTEGFLLATGLEPDDNDSFLEAFYFSLVTLGTLGHGKITPLTPWLRIVSPLQALVGFALFTASISWILSVYPVLGRRRQLAREVALLRRGRSAPGLRTVEDAPAALEGTLLSLAEQVNAICGDLEQFPITYYFHLPDEQSALPVALPDLVALAREGQHHGSPAVRLQSTLLLEAIHDLAGHVGETFDRRGADLGDALAAYAVDHFYLAPEPAQAASQ